MAKLGRLAVVWAVLIAVVAAGCSSSPAAQPTAAGKAATTAASQPGKINEYNVVYFADETGLEATIGPSMKLGTELAVKTWNESKGAKIGVKLNLKTYDGGSDAARVISQWASALSELKPIAVWSPHGLHSQTLSQRLPQDKVPDFLAGTHPWIWTPNGWQFSFRATYVEELAALLDWYRANVFKQDRPMKVGWVVATDNVRMVEIDKGIHNWAQAQRQGKIEVAPAVQIPNNPTDVTSQVRTLLDGNPDFIYGGYLAPQTVAIVRAMTSLGKRAPFGVHSQNAITVLQGLDPKLDLTGIYQTAGQRTSAEINDPGLAQLKAVFKDMPADKTITDMTIAGPWWVYPAGATIERAVAKVGADKLTGQVLYDVVSTGTYGPEDSLGLAGRTIFTPARGGAPSKGQVRITMLKDGKATPAVNDWVDVPEMDRPF